ADRVQWALTIAQGFFERTEFTTEELDMTAVIFSMPAATPFIAMVDGEAAAASVMTRQNHLAMLAGDATVPRYRRRGLQAAMIQARLAYAATHGCDLAVAAVWPGSASQTNYERLGFRLVYTKALMILE
ncbi:MAG: GNAT family N-acetyltransferase, partial [Acidobacteriaceae bacterium]|nr:GNAT family N-acetyltransferase [Acidobacteriaceae bacterium]